MAITQKTLNISCEETLANCSNIIRSLDEMGIKNTDKNRFFIQLVLIMNERSDGLDEAQILENFLQVLRISKNFESKKV